MNVGFPFPARFDLVALGDFITVLRFDVAVEAKVRLLVHEGGAVGIDGDVAVGVFESGAGGAGERSGGGGESDG